MLEMGEQENTEAVTSSQNDESDAIMKERASNSVQWQYAADVFLFVGSMVVVLVYFVSAICWLR
jgi:hypothetical protein